MNNSSKENEKLKKSTQMKSPIMNQTAWSSLDPKNVKTAGEFGRRITQIIENNLLKVDVQKTFLERLQKRTDVSGLLGYGNFINALVWLSYQTGHEQLRKLKEKLIADIIATQDAEGYIGILRDKSLHIRALWDMHERGYLIHGLVEDFRYFGNKPSLNAAIKLADHMLAGFEKDPTLRPNMTDGDPSLPHLDFIPFPATNLGCDFAMLELTKVTGDARYRDFAVNFLKLKEYSPKIECGPSSLGNHAYTQLGHCLAQLNLFSMTGEEALLETTRKTLEFLLKEEGMVITATCSEAECWHQTQSGLQNLGETCTGFYLNQFMEALLRLEGKSLYGDIMERSIHNAMFAAISPDGRRNRYHTPFDGKRHYDKNGDTFCCHNNFRRFMSRLSSWIYYLTPDGVAVNLYNSSSGKMMLTCGTGLEISQETDYPTSGNIRLVLSPAVEKEFTLRLRIPRWCRQGKVRLNGAEAKDAPGGDFYQIRRLWKKGDVVELELEMQYRWVRGRQSQVGRVAIMHGPKVFTLNPERTPKLSSHPDFEPRLVMVDPDRPVEVVPDEHVRPGGVAAIVQGWGSGDQNFWPHLERVPTTLSEFPDPDGEGIYFVVPDLKSDKIGDDELMGSKAKGNPPCCHP